MANLSYDVAQLPQYLENQIHLLTKTSDSDDGLETHQVQVLDLDGISKLDGWSLRYTHLLLRRHALTDEISRVGLYPPLLYQRALAYEALGYADLAAADAFVTYTLCETVRCEEWVSDLEPIQYSGEAWEDDGENGQTNLAVLCDALAVLCRSLIDLKTMDDANEKFEELVERYGELLGWNGDNEDLRQKTKQKLNKVVRFGSQLRKWDIVINTKHKFAWGWSRREIYPWNEHEPDRNSAESLSEINEMLANSAPDLVARVTILPALNEDGTSSGEIWQQLGLFAARDLSPGREVLREKSLLTAIRPLDDALCDGCGADLESISRDTMRQCAGADCDTTFCSEDCATRAANEYHKPNTPKNDDENGSNEYEHEDDSESDHPPSHAPFCGNSALHEIGRTSSTTTAEWDLYFLLLTRAIQMSTTQSTHPLSLTNIKYLWGDFNPPPTTNTDPPKPQLPWSLHHNLTLPLQYFETLSLSRPDLRPYTRTWLARFDWWTQTTLLAKFRGVANARQSTFDGKPEVAAVHPLWCLANHSCAPNVSWLPVGERVFVVRQKIKEGGEVWSHYTDVRLGVGERRERLLEVLGGVCRCVRCVKESNEEG